MADQDAFDEIIQAFRDEALELLNGLSDAMLKIEKKPSDDEQAQLINLAFRYAHNIKGAAASLGLFRVEKLIHSLEDIFSAVKKTEISFSVELADTIFSVLDLLLTMIRETDSNLIEIEPQDQEVVDTLNRITSSEQTSAESLEDQRRETPKTAQADQSQATSSRQSNQHSVEEEYTDSIVRVSKKKLDTMMGQLGELVEMKIRMEEILIRITEVEDDLRRREKPGFELPHKPLRQLARGMEHDITYLSKLLKEIQTELLELRMVPVHSIFPILQRTVRDVSRIRGLAVDLRLEGGQIELDRKIVEEIKNPLIHLLRNAVDHGIEPVSLRKKLGKSETGDIHLKVSHRGSSIQLEIIDDGRGIDSRKVYDRAVELGMLKPSAGIPSSSDIYRLLFVAGMTTSTTTDMISGRGVGMSEVKKAMESVRGSISIESEEGKGTRFVISLPLSMTTDIGLFVSTQGTKFVIPRAAVLQVLALKEQKITNTNGFSSLLYDGIHIPLTVLEPTLHLRTFLPDADRTNSLAIVLSSAESMAAIVVDDVEAEVEIVIRTLGTFFEQQEIISGMTISASGDIYFVLNPADLVRIATTPASPSNHVTENSSTACINLKPSRDTVVLVVDDSATSRILNQKLLSASGFRVILANDGRQALEVLRNQICHLILTDVQMPQMDGYELTKIVKQDPHLASIPVILLTALDAREDRERGIQSGADAYLIKRELTQQELVTTIEQLI